MSFRLPRCFCLVPLLVVVAAALPLACDKAPERPEDALSPSGPVASAGSPGAGWSSVQTTPTTRGSAIDLGRDVAGDLRRRANDGDVQAMMVLARFYESRNSETDRAEARRWYKRAADAGDSSAKDALRTMEAREKGLPEPGPSTDASSAQAGADGERPATQVADADPIDRTKTRWKDLMRL